MIFHLAKGYRYDVISYFTERYGIGYMSQILGYLTPMAMDIRVKKAEIFKLPLHLDVASPTSILTLHQCCRSFDGLMFPISPFPILLRSHCCCCFSLNVASTCNAPKWKWIIFNCTSLQLVTTQGVSHTLNLWSFTSLLWCCQSSSNVVSPPWCCYSSFDVAVPSSMLLLLLLCCHFTLMLQFLPWYCHSFFDVPATHLCYCSSNGVASPPSMSLKIWVQDPVSGIKDQVSGIKDPGWPISEQHFDYLVTPHNVLPLWKNSTFKWDQKRN